MTSPSRPAPIPGDLPATLDVNILVSAVLGPHGPSHRAVRAWQEGHFVHLTSAPIIAAFEAKLADPAIIRRFPFWPAVGQELVPRLRTEAVLVPVTPADVVPVTGDPEDDAVLATARLGGARYLVTGDRVLLALGTHAGVEILTPRAFVGLLGDAPPPYDDQTTTPSARTDDDGDGEDEDEAVVQ